jgi:hypothetical protein
MESICLEQDSNVAYKTTAYGILILEVTRQAVPYIDQAARLRLLIKETLVQSLVTSGEFLGGGGDTGAGLSPSSSVFL